MRLRLYFRLGLLLILVVLCSTCGIANYDYLYPPTDQSDAILSTTRILSHNTENANASSFSGYKIYYKIYGSSSDTAPDSAASDASYIDSSWTSTYPDTIFQKISSTYGYKEIVGLDVSNGYSLVSTPLVRIKKTSLSDAVIASLNLEDGTITITDSTTSSQTNYAIRRKVIDTDASYKKFTDQLDSTDKDADVNYTDGSKYCWIRIYAIAYGQDNSFTDVYSIPCVLAATINIPSK